MKRAKCPLGRLMRAVSSPCPTSSPLSLSSESCVCTFHWKSYLSTLDGQVDQNVIGSRTGSGQVPGISAG